MFILPIINKLIKILRSQGSPAQIAWGFALGMTMAFMPLWTLTHFIILFIVIILNINIGSFVLGFTLFKLFAFILDPVFHQLGYQILVGMEFLKPFFATLENMPLIPFTRFNNTVVMGGTITAFLLLYPIFRSMKWIVVNYRKKIDPKIEKLKIVKILKSSKIYKFYKMARDWRQA